MKLIKKIMKVLLKLIIGLGIFVGLYFLATYVCKTWTVNNDYQPNGDYVDAFLSTNGMHTDIILPVKHKDFDWFSFLDSTEFKDEERPEYLSFGWGDKGFYLETPTWDDLTIPVAARAALVPSPTAMHVTYCSTAPQENEHFKKIRIDPDKLQELNSFINSYFDTKSGKKPIMIDCCRYNSVNDNFYEAHGSYHAFFTCNNWTNACLKKSGIKTAIWAPFASGVLHNID